MDTDDPPVLPAVTGDQVGSSWSIAAYGIDWATIMAAPSWLLAVLISVGASALTVTGFVIQKRALHDAEIHDKRWPRIGDVVLSPAWVGGFLVTATFPVIGDLLAYSLAPLSLTAPLSGISVVLNMVIAPWILREQLQRFPDAPATALILLGCLFTTAFGDHDRTAPYGAKELLDFACKPPFLVGSIVGLMCEVFVIAQLRRLRPEIERLASEQPHNPHLPHVLLPALAAALCGAVANIGLKGVGELLRSESPRVQVVACVLIVAPAAILQVNFINRGLFLYPQSVFISVYGALLILMNTMYGALFYEEYKPLLASRVRLFWFACGCSLIMVGIWLFRLREPVKGDAHKDDEEEGLLSMENIAESVKPIKTVSGLSAGGPDSPESRLRSSRSMLESDGI